MSAQIIQFPAPSQERKTPNPYLDYKSRVERLPEWTRAWDVEWLYKEVARRRRERLLDTQV